MSEMRTSNFPKTLPAFLSEGDQTTAKVYLAIARAASRLADELPLHTGMAGGVNPSGESQAKLDVFSNDLFADALLETGVVGEVASEEMEEPRRSNAPAEESLAVAMDPLDGSSNIVTNSPLGSIFGIWRGRLPQSGRGLVSAMFVTYGPQLTLCFSHGNRVCQFVKMRVGPQAGEFVLASEGMRLPDPPEVYGFGGERNKWTPRVEAFVRSLEERGLKLRYGGTFIGDYNQVLRRGGIFAYPELKGRPNGKLRILYESAPVSYLTELAGGASTTGRGSVLDITPTTLAETAPCYIGDRNLVREVEERFARS